MVYGNEFGSSTFIPGNITSLFYSVPGEASFGSNNETAAGLLLGGDATMFWFEVTEQGNKTVLDQDGAKFQLGETTILPGEGSCLLMASSKRQALFVQIGVSCLVSATVIVADGSCSRSSRFSGRKGYQSFERQRRARQLQYCSQQHRRPGGVQPDRLGGQPAPRRVVRQRHRSERDHFFRFVRASTLSSWYRGG
jgi:hypothetical protein